MVDSVAPLPAAVTKIEDVISTVMGAWLNVDVGAVWGSVWDGDVKGAAGGGAEVEIVDDDVGMVWLVLGDGGVALGSVLVVEGPAGGESVVVLGVSI